MDKYKLLISMLGSVMMGLFVFIVIVDPTNTLLHKKDIAFILIVTFSLLVYKPRMHNLPYIIILFCSIAIPWLVSSIRMNPSDETEVLAAFKSISPIVLLLWIDRYDMMKIARIPVVLCCLASVVVYVLISSNPLYEEGFWLFMKQYDYPVNVSRRSILGFTILGFYLKSCVSFLMILAYYMLGVLKKTRLNLLTMFSLFVMIAYFMVSGTRSTMLAPFFLLIVIVTKVYKNSKYYKYIIYPTSALLAVSFLGVLISMVTETDEYSNVIKYGHISSYLELFEENPSYLLWGQGPGTCFFSEGFGEFVYRTEWSYLDLIRCYGVFSISITYVFVKPLISFWKERNKDNLVYCTFWSYLAYLFIAGTNPLLLSSTGMITLLMAYSYENKILSKDEERISVNVHI